MPRRQLQLSVHAAFIQTYNSKNVLEAHTLIPSGSVIDGNGGANYAVTFENSITYSITPRPLTVAAGDATRVYGAPEPGFRCIIKRCGNVPPGNGGWPVSRQYIEHPSP